MLGLQLFFVILRELIPTPVENVKHYEDRWEQNPGHDVHGKCRVLLGSLPQIRLLLGD